MEGKNMHAIAQQGQVAQNRGRTVSRSLTLKEGYGNDLLK
jgi:hypothetical protein